MDTVQNNGSKEDNLNDSWVDLHFRSGGSTPRSINVQGNPLENDVPSFLQHGQMEKLLLEAQRESSRSTSSQASLSSSTRASPKSPHSPTNELATDTLRSLQEQKGEVLESLQGSDWIWDWSSRPEVMPPNEMARQFKHKKRSNLSVRNSRAMKEGLFRMENLPTLLFTHACTFLMGAAVMFIYFKKYCKFTALAIQQVD